MEQIKKISIVTGCAGFLGSHLVEALLRRGEHVIGIDNLERGQEGLNNLKEIENHVTTEEYERFTFVCKDVRHIQVLPKADTVYHLAALPSHRLALENPHKFIEVDIMGTENILEAVRYMNPRPLVVMASTNKVYGKQECPWSEGQTPMPEGPYAVGKYASELLCSMYNKYFNVPSVVVRYHHVAGPRSNPELALSIFTDRALKGETLEVHGKFAENGFESCSANYTHVNDAIRATLMVADNYSGFDIFNIAHHTTVTVESMARFIINRLSSKSSIQYVDMLSHETLVHASSVAKISDRVGFVASRSAEDAFSDYIEWRLREKK